MRRGSRLLSVALLLAASVVAVAHGGTYDEVQEEGPYKVTFTTFQGVTVGELVREFWFVQDRQTGDPANVSDPRVRVSFFGEGNALSNQSVEPLEQPVAGSLHGDFRMAVKGRVVYDLLLPGAEVVFAHPICEYSERGELVCAGGESIVRAFDLAAFSVVAGSLAVVGISVYLLLQRSENASSRSREKRRQRKKSGR